MAKGFSLHIGLNYIDPTHYDGNDGSLPSCINDAHQMLKIATKLGYQTQILRNEGATRDAVKEQILQVANQITSDDIFLLTYSGHGCQIPNIGPAGEEKDDADDTWALYDGQLVDDELWHLWSYFPDNARILVFLDSCHSESAVKVINLSEEVEEINLLPKSLSSTVAVKTFEKNEEFYLEIMSELPNPPKDVNARILLIAGCQENQTSRAGSGPWSLSALTKQVVNVWDRGKFEGSYEDFYSAIVARMPDLVDQYPTCTLFGKRDQNFLLEKPFSIG